MNANNKVLLVEDDQALATLVAEYLQAQEFQVVHESRGDLAVERIASDPPDVVLLDVNLPGMDGFSVCRAVRPKYRGVIIMLTARSEEVDEVVGLEVGADDYIVKPVRPRALLARLRMHLRRSEVDETESSTKPITVGELTISVANRTAVLAGESLDLTTAEFELLVILAQNAGTPVSRNQIYQALLGIRYDGLDRSIDLRVSRLRRKLGDDPTKPQRVKSIRGVGYLMPQD